MAVLFRELLSLLLFVCVLKVDLIEVQAADRLKKSGEAHPVAAGCTI